MKTDGMNSTAAENELYSPSATPSPPPPSPPSQHHWKQPSLCFGWSKKKFASSSSSSSSSAERTLCSLCFVSALVAKPIVSSESTTTESDATPESSNTLFSRHLVMTYTEDVARNAKELESLLTNDSLLNNQISDILPTAKIVKIDLSASVNDKISGAGAFVVNNALKPYAVMLSKYSNSFINGHQFELFQRLGAAMVEGQPLKIGYKLIDKWTSTKREE